MSINVGVKINENFFDDFQINIITCWEHIELWAIIKNIPIDENLVYFIVTGGKFFKSLYYIILDIIKNTNRLDKFINLDFFDLIYKTFDYPRAYEMFDITYKWIMYSMVYRNNTELYTSEHRNKSIELKYEIFTVLGNKFPDILNEFCNKNKKLLHSTDKEFLKWAQTNFNINIEYREDDYISDTYGFYIKK